MMTATQKALWDHGFDLHERGIKLLSNSDPNAYSGWMTAHTTESGQCPCEPKKETNEKAKK